MMTRALFTINISLSGRWWTVGRGLVLELLYARSACGQEGGTASKGTEMRSVSRPGAGQLLLAAIGLAEELSKL